MAKADYLPARDNDFLVWHDQFKSALAESAAALGLTAAETGVVGTDNTSLHARNTALNSAAAQAQQATADKSATRQVVEKNVRNLVRRIKAQPAYTTALGAQLGVEGSQNSTDLTTAQPSLAGSDQTGGMVQLDFSKSKSDGVNIYGQREGDTGFVFLARDTSSPYVDNRPLLAVGKPEVRKYKAVYVLSDEEIGQFSHEITVTCQP